MKTLLLISLSVISFAGFAQKSISVDAVPQATSKDAQFSFVVEIPQTTQKDVEKDWLRYVADGSKGKSDAVDNIYHQSDAFHSNISAYPFDVYSKLRETSDGVRLTAWFTQNNAAFISQDSNNGQHLAAQKFLRDFAVQEYREAVQNELNVEQDKLGEMEKELVALIKSEEKSVKTINENERSNVRANEAISTTDADIRSSSYEIYDQKEMVETTASDPKATKGAKKTLRNMESDKEDLQKDNEKKNMNIDSRDKENRAEERSMANSRQLQERKTADIENQRQLVIVVQTKLDNIK